MSQKSLIRAALSFLVVFILLTQMDLTALLHKSKAIDLPIFLCATLAMAVQILFLNLRWQAFLNVGGKSRIDFHTAMIMNIAGYFANVFFIASIGGIVAKSALAVRKGIHIFHAIFATLFDRFMTLFALIVFGAFGLPFLIGTIDKKITVLFAASIAVICMALAILVLALQSGVFSKFFLSSRKRSKILVVMRAFFTDFKMMAKSCGYSLCAQASFFIGVYILSLGIDTAHSQHITFFALLPILALIASLPISFGGWGIREGAFIYGLGLIGYSMENAFFLSVQVGLASMIAPILIGIPYLLRDDLKDLLLGQNNSNPRMTA